MACRDLLQQTPGMVEPHSCRTVADADQAASLASLHPEPPRTPFAKLNACGQPVVHLDSDSDCEQGGAAGQAAAAEGAASDAMDQASPLHNGSAQMPPDADNSGLAAASMLQAPGAPQAASALQAAGVWQATGALGSADTMQDVCTLGAAATLQATSIPLDVGVVEAGC